MTKKYTHEELLHRLDKPGWRMVTAKPDTAMEGTLGALAKASHARHAQGEALGYLQEVATRIEIDLVQLQELWRHLGLPV